jgi:hypothetical protein
MLPLKSFAGKLAESLKNATGDPDFASRIQAVYFAVPSLRLPLLSHLC